MNQDSECSLWGASHRVFSSQPKSKENRYPPTQIGPAPGFWLKEFFGRSLGVRWVRSRADVPNSQTVARFWSAPSWLLRVQHVHRWRPHQLSSAFSHLRNIRSIRGYATFSRLPVISVSGVRKTTNSLPLSPDQWDSPPEESYDWIIGPWSTHTWHLNCITYIFNCLSKDAGAFSENSPTHVKCERMDRWLGSCDTQFRLV